ncbi:helix-turn-helix transcriptional regulator [Janibacter melonis]|uniref:helix-turn-helix transcriptional regulator n=1 Tax=Janibacter melonis TaxID=262209 RepID=UPI001919E832|nr:helix-turn-helix domain-containing protein [Janibacter melonis]
MVNTRRAAQPHDLGPAESDARTRDRVLATVSERGPITAARLAADLGLTPPGVRRHLDQLALDGLVEDRDPAASKRGRGRPAREWVVTGAGHDVLPAGYETLAGDAVRFLAAAAGPQAVADFARARMARVEERYAADVTAAGPDPRARTEALVSALRREGFAASARPVGAGGLAGVQLCQGHCPVQHVAAEFPDFCEAERESFSRLLGVHVQRLATLAQGDHVCTTFVPTPDIPPSTSSSTHPEERGSR